MRCAGLQVAYKETAMSEILTVKPMNINEIILSDLGHRLSGGGKLSMAEQGMAIMATAALDANRFGPGPAEMKLTANPLPENVKGALAQFSA